MALDFYSNLDRLLNPTQDLGGAPGGEDSARAMAQLILGGGQASMEDPSGKMQPFLGTGVDPSLRAALPPSLQKVMESADRIAAGARGDLAGTPSIATPGQGNALVANPYGPGSYDPTNQAAVEQVQRAGEDARKAAQAQQMLERFTPKAPATDFASILNEITSGAANKAESERLRAAAPGMIPQIAGERLRAYSQQQAAAQPLIAKILESMGLGDDAYKKAFKEAKGKAEGEIAGGKLDAKAKGKISNELLRAAGTDKFAESMGKAVAEGSIDSSQALNLERLHDSRTKQAMVPDPDRRIVQNLDNSKRAMQDTLDAYKDTDAYKTGSVSQSLKLALARNSAVASIQEAMPIEGANLNDSDRKFVAKYNTLVARLKSFGDDPRFSDRDALNTLKGLGNPAVGPKLYTEQVQTFMNDISERRGGVLDALQSQGRNVSGFRPKATTGVPAAGDVRQGYVFLGGDPSKKESWRKQ